MSDVVPRRGRRPSGAAAAKPARRRSRRRLLLGALLVVGVAAILIVLQRDPDRAADADPSVASGENAAPAATVETGAAALSSAAGQGLQSAAASTSDDAAIEMTPRHRLAMLPTLHESTSQPSIESVEAAYGVILNVFRSMPNLDVFEVIESELEAAEIDVPRQAALLGLEPPLDDVDRDFVIANHFGAEYVVRVRNELPIGPGSAERWRIVVGYRGPAVGGDQGTGVDPVVETQRTVESIGTSLARYVYAQLFPEEGTAVYEAVVMDARESDDERLEALYALSSSVPGFDLSELSDAALTASLELAREAASAGMRREIWALLGRTRDPRVEQPLTDALLYDAAAEVRAEAASTLFGFLPDPVTRAALEGAAVNDPSGEVRLKARWSFMTESERKDYLTSALLNRSLPPEDRMAPLLLARAGGENFDFANGFYPDELTLNDAQLAALAEIARADGGVAARQAALAELGQSRRRTVLEPMIAVSRDDPDPRIRRAAVAAIGSYRGFFGAGVVDALLPALRSDPDAGVRRAAVSALSDQVGWTVVDDALETARNTDPDLGVREAIDELLASEEN